MRKERILFIVGIWLMVLPYLGFPVGIKKILFTVTGFVIVSMSYLLYVEKKIRISKKANTPLHVTSPLNEDVYSEVQKRTHIPRRRTTTKDIVHKSEEVNSELHYEPIEGTTSQNEN